MRPATCSSSVASAGSRMVGSLVDELEDARDRAGPSWNWPYMPAMLERLVPMATP